MIVVDRLVAGGSVRAADQGIGRIVSKGNPACPLDATEVVAHGLPDDHRQRDAPAARLILKLPVRVLGESKICRHVFRHRGITISAHRGSVNDKEDHPRPV